MGHVKPSMEDISRMLMEEEEDDMEDGRFDQAAVIQAQQSLAHIIASSSSSSLDGAATKLYVAAAEVEAEHNWSSMVTMSFLTGTVEARKLLPATNNTLGFMAGDMIKKYRKGGNELEMNRACKLMATAAPEEEEANLHEMVNRMMLSDCEESREEMEALRAAMKDGDDGSAASQQRPRRLPLQAVDLRTLLIRCAEKVKDDDRRGAVELLSQIRRHASPTGDATQRLAHCFAAALETRLAGAGAAAVTWPKQRWRPAAMAPEAKFLEAYRVYAATCCFKKAAFTFANTTICRAAAGRRRLHVVDYGVSFGFQWLGLLRLLAARDGGPPAVTITGIDLPQPGFRPASHIHETGRHLSICARELGVPFKFRAIAAANWDAIRVGDLRLAAAAADDDDGVVVVNSAFRLETVADDGVEVDSWPSPRDVVLATIRRMRPAVFTHGVFNGFYGSSFFPRFREALFDYSAMFDVLDATMPRTSRHRLVLERDVLAPLAMNVVACEGRNRTDRSDSYPQWQLRMQRAGLRQLPLDREVVGAVREMVKKQQYHKDFVIDEDRRWLLQGWKGRILYAHSTWVASS